MSQCNGGYFRSDFCFVFFILILSHCHSVTHSQKSEHCECACILLNRSLSRSFVCRIFKCNINWNRATCGACTIGQSMMIIIIINAHNRIAKHPQLCARDMDLIVYIYFARARAHTNCACECLAVKQERKMSARE